MNHKTLYPNNLERQNVTLVDNIFHYSTIAAEFCEIVRKWWDIVNTKSTLKGRFKRNELCQPVSSDTDIRFQFLENFVAWLNIWKESENNVGSLTKDTCDALLITTKSIMSLVKISLGELKVDFVLIGKLQTDDLESRSRLYRSLVGCNYKISYTELVECEKKIRIHNVFAHNKKDFTKLLQDHHDNSLYNHLSILIKF